MRVRPTTMIGKVIIAMNQKTHRQDAYWENMAPMNRPRTSPINLNCHDINKKLTIPNSAASSEDPNSTSLFRGFGDGIDK